MITAQTLVSNSHLCSVSHPASTQDIGAQYIVLIKRGVCACVHKHAHTCKSSLHGFPSWLEPKSIRGSQLGNEPSETVSQSKPSFLSFVRDKK